MSGWIKIFGSQIASKALFVKLNDVNMFMCFLWCKLFNYISSSANDSLISST